MPRAVWFDVPADDPTRAIGFYREVFGWKAQKWNGPMDYWALTTGEAGEPGIDGGIGPRQIIGAPHNTIGVPSVEEYSAKVEAAGGKVLTPKTTMPGVGYVSICQDTEGNVFGIMAFDSSA